MDAQGNSFFLNIPAQGLHCDCSYHQELDWQRVAHHCTLDLDYPASVYQDSNCVFCSHKQGSHFASLLSQGLDWSFFLLQEKCSCLYFSCVDLGCTVAQD